MVMFWQENDAVFGGDPAGGLATRQCVRLAGAAFFIFGLAAVRTYSFTGRSSVCYLSFRRSSSKVRTMGPALELAEASGGFLAVISNRVVAAQPGIPTTRSSFLFANEGLNALISSAECGMPRVLLRPPGWAPSEIVVLR